jgi:hypothetical protein
MNSKTEKQSNSKQTKNLTRHFSEEHKHMANKHMKRCTMSLFIEELQI